MKKSKTKNEKLIIAIQKAGYKVGTKFAEVAGIDYESLSGYANSTLSPIGEDGLIRLCAWSLCDALNLSPSDLWSEEHFSIVSNGNTDTYADIGTDVGADCTQREASLNQASRLIDIALSCLDANSANVIRLLHLMDVDKDIVALSMDVTYERVKQIEARAKKKLRQSVILQEFAGFSL